MSPRELSRVSELEVGKSCIVILIFFSFVAGALYERKGARPLWSYVVFVI
jgi:hypothetical protein